VLADVVDSEGECLFERVRSTILFVVCLSKMKMERRRRKRRTTTKRS
jgi:hypothetical protein